MSGLSCLLLHREVDKDVIFTHFEVRFVYLSESSVIHFTNIIFHKVIPMCCINSMVNKSVQAYLNIVYRMLTGMSTCTLVIFILFQATGESCSTLGFY